MRLLGTILMIVGAFCMMAAVLAVAGPHLRANGVEVVGAVTSVPGALVGGALMLIGGATLRRWAIRRRVSRSRNPV